MGWLRDLVIQIGTSAANRGIWPLSTVVKDVATEVEEPTGQVEPTEKAVPAAVERVFVRQLSKNEADWRDGSAKDGDHANLSRITFTGTEAEPVSVYEVASDLEEATVATALQVVMRGTASKHAYLLRIRSSRLSEVGVSIDPENRGTTGVGAVDDLHRDLVGSVESFQALTRTLLDAILAGSDSVREVRQTQLHHQSRLLLNGNVDDKAKRKLERACGGNQSS